MEQFRITRLGHHGDGIAEGPLFAPLTLPDEIITGTVDGKTITDIKIVTPSDQRVKPICTHYKSCGGCQLMHAADDFVAQWKVDVVKTALAAHGIETDLRPCLTSPTGSRRRATFSARRTKKGASVGFHARGSDVIVEIPNCKLLTPALIAAQPVIAELTKITASRKGELSVSVTQTANGLDISVTGGRDLDGPLHIILGQFCETHKFARLSWNDDTVALRAAPIQTFASVQVVPPAGSFLQATKEGEQDLVTTVADIVGTAPKIVDLFSGCGTFSLPLAHKAEVHAVEGSAAMIAALDQGWRKSTGLKKVTSEARDLFRRPLLPDELNKFDAIVIDPPRAGAEAQIAEIAGSTVSKIAYVSCNPTTFARDAAQLISAGYSLTFVQTVDQFRWSSHIELVAAFERI